MAKAPKIESQGISFWLVKHLLEESKILVDFQGCKCEVRLELLALTQGTLK